MIILASKESRGKKSRCLSNVQRNKTKCGDPLVKTESEKDEESDGSPITNHSPTNDPSPHTNINNISFNEDN